MDKSFTADKLIGQTSWKMVAIFDFHQPFGK